MISIRKKDDKEITAETSKEVILSGGTIGSAQLLLLSGIGNAEELKTHGIERVLLEKSTRYALP